MKLSNLRSLLFLLMFATITSCSSKLSYRPVNTTLKIEKLTAHNLEEDDTAFSTGSDEILVYYSIAAVDPNNVITSVNNGVWGINNVTGRGTSYTGFDPLDLKVPAKGHLVISIALYEVDNESTARSIVRQSKNYVRVARYAGRGSFTLAEANALRMISRTLGIAGFALFLVDVLDNDDLLGQHQYSINANQLQELSGKYGTLRLKMNTSGTNNGDYYHYNIDYQLNMSPAQGEILYERVKKKRMKAPFIIFEFSPLVFPESPNELWVKPKEKILEELDGDKGLEWSDGLHNTSFSARLGIGISPVLPLGNASGSRFFISALLDRYKFTLNNQFKFYAPETYFEPITHTGNNAPLGDPSKIAFELKQYGLGASWRALLGRAVFLELQSGIKYAEGRVIFATNFNHFPVGVKLTHNNSNNLIKRQYQPFGSVKLGLGSNRRLGGLHLFGGVNIERYNFLFKDDYQSIISENKIPADFTNPNYVFNYSLGISLSF